MSFTDTLTTLKDFTTAVQQLLDDSAAKDATIAQLRAQIAALTPISFVWDNLNQSKAWIAPANVGDTGGASNLPAGTSVLIPGSPLTERFTPAHSFNNAYIYLELEKLATASGALLTSAELQALSTFTISLEFSLPKERKTWQAFEFELQYANAGWVYNMAWQILPTGALRAFQYITKQWVDTGLRCNASELDAGQIMRVIAEFRANQNAMAETHTRITVDGTVMPVNFSQPAESGVGEYMHCAFQVDTDAKQDTYTLAVGNIRVETS